MVTKHCKNWFGIGQFQHFSYCTLQAVNSSEFCKDFCKTFVFLLVLKVGKIISLIHQICFYDQKSTNLVPSWFPHGSLMVPSCTEVRYASFFSGGFITTIVVNPPERKLAKRTSVHCIEYYHTTTISTFFLSTSCPFYV